MNDTSLPLPIELGPVVPLVLTAAVLATVLELATVPTDCLFDLLATAAVHVVPKQSEVGHSLAASIRRAANAQAVGLATLPSTAVGHAVGPNDLAKAVGAAADPLATVNRAVWPPLRARPLPLTATPLAPVRGA